MLTLRYVTTQGQYHVVGLPSALDKLWSILHRDDSILILELLDLNGTRLDYYAR